MKKFSIHDTYLRAKIFMELSSLSEQIQRFDKS